MDFKLSNVEILGEIVVGNSKLEAFYNDKKIGFIDFQVTPDIDGEVCIAYPSLMNVDASFRHKGVATKIIEEAKKTVTVIFQAALGYSGNSDYIHYSDDGLSFKNYCEENKITKPQEI